VNQAAPTSSWNRQSNGVEWIGKEAREVDCETQPILFPDNCDFKDRWGGASCKDTPKTSKHEITKQNEFRHCAT